MRGHWIIDRRYCRERGRCYSIQTRGAFSTTTTRCTLWGDECEMRTSQDGIDRMQRVIDAIETFHTRQPTLTFAQSIWNKFKSIINPIYYCITTPLRPSLSTVQLPIDSGSTLDRCYQHGFRRIGLDTFFTSATLSKAFLVDTSQSRRVGTPLQTAWRHVPTKYWICWSSSKNTHVRDRVERGNLNREFGTRSNFSNYLLKYQRKRNEKAAGRSETRPWHDRLAREVEAESSEVKVKLMVVQVYKTKRKSSDKTNDSSCSVISLHNSVQLRGGNIHKSNDFVLPNIHQLWHWKCNLRRCLTQNQGWRFEDKKKANCLINHW